MRILATLAVLPVLLSTSSSGTRPASNSAGETRLAWKFQQGEVIRYRILQEMHQAMSGMGNFEVESNIGQVLKETVQSVTPDGTAKLECTWEALRIHMSIPMGGDMDFDSTRGDGADTAPGPLKGMAKLQGSSFQMEMKPTGEIVSLHGVTEVMEKVFSGEGAGAGMLKNTMSKAFNDDSMKRALETTLLPDKAVVVGDAWKRDAEFDVPSLGKLKTHFDFKFAGMEDMGGSSCAKLGVQYEMTIGGGKPDFSSMPGADHFDIDLSMDDAQGEGTIHFSAEKGRMVQTKLVSDMDMSMNMKPKSEGKAGSGEPIKMEIKINTHLTTSLLGEKDPSFEPEAKKEGKPEPKKDAGKKNP